VAAKFLTVLDRYGWIMSDVLEMNTVWAVVIIHVGGITIATILRMWELSVQQQVNI
jgi:hypothetical protein